MSGPSAIELQDVVSVGIDHGTTDSTSLLPVFNRASPPNQPKEKERSCWGYIFKDWSQYLITGKGTGKIVLAGIDAIAGAAMWAVETTPEVDKIKIIGGAALLGINAVLLLGDDILDGVVWLRVRMLKPQMSFENQANKFGDEVEDLRNVVDITKQTKEEFKALFLESRDMLTHQKEITRDIKTIFKENLAELGRVREALQVQVEKVTHLEQVFEQAKTQTAAAKDLTAGLKGQNREMQDILKEVGVLEGNVQDLDATWDENAHQIVGETDEYAKQNAQMLHLQAQLKAQMELMAKYLEAIKLYAEKIKADMQQIDETDDKVIAATHEAREAAEQERRNLEMQRQRGRQDSLLLHKIEDTMRAGGGSSSSSSSGGQ